MKAPLVEDYMQYDYENEEPTDEARTNEEAYEDMQQHYAKFQPEGLKALGSGAIIGEGNCVFFNEEEQVSGEEEESSEDEEGEFYPEGREVEIVGGEEEDEEDDY